MAKKRYTRRSAEAQTAGSSQETRGEPAEQLDAQSGGAGTSGLKWREPYSIIPVAVAIAVSLNCLANGFAADDLQQVLNNPLIKDLANIPGAFTSTVWTYSSENIIFTVDRYYRPLFNVFLTINYTLFGTSAFGWHMVNILIDATVAYLIFRAIKGVSRSEWIALAAAILFAAHPAHAESVAWISGATDPLMALFVLPSFLLYLRYRQTHSRWSLAASLSLFFVGLLCKETALALPIVIGYCEIWHFEDDRNVKARLTAAGIVLCWMAIPVAVYLAMRVYTLGGLLPGSGAHLPLSVGLLMTPKLLVEYLRLTFVPWGYSYMHWVDPVTSVLDPGMLACVALIIAIAVGIIWSRSRLVWFSAVFFLVWLLPAIAAARTFDPEFMAQERYLYLSVAGAALAISLAWRWLWNARLIPNGLRQGLATAMVVVIAGTFLIMHVRQNAVWSDNLSLYHNCVTQDPSLVQARAALGAVYLQAGRTKDADEEEHKANDLDRQSPDPYLFWSSQANQQGRIDRAIEILEDGVKAVPPGLLTTNRLGTMYLNLGMLYERQKNFDRAEQDMQKSIELWRRPAASYYLGQLYVDEGHYQQALGAYEDALSQLPRRFGPIHLKLAHVYEELGDKEVARSEYQQFIELTHDPEARSDAARKLSQL
ncbi:MAG TPA: tetratricopeptide repeat protein [Blastocatellia bacterium]